MFGHIGPQLPIEDGGENIDGEDDTDVRDDADKRQEIGKDNGDKRDECDDDQPHHNHGQRASHSLGLVLDQISLKQQTNGSDDDRQRREQMDDENDIDGDNHVLLAGIEKENGIQNGARSFIKPTTVGNVSRHTHGKIEQHQGHGKDHCGRSVEMLGMLHLDEEVGNAAVSSKSKRIDREATSNAQKSHVLMTGVAHLSKHSLMVADVQVRVVVDHGQCDGHDSGNKGSRHPKVSHESHLSQHRKSNQKHKQQNSNDQRKQPRRNLTEDAVQKHP